MKTDNKFVVCAWTRMEWKNDPNYPWHTATPPSSADDAMLDALFYLNHKKNIDDVIIFRATRYGHGKTELVLFAKETR